MADEAFRTQKYWHERSDMLYYRYIDYLVRSLGTSATRMLDVGTGNCPYLDWFDWIETRVSVDIRVPYSAPGIQGVKGDIHELDLGAKFDLVTSLQVLEHVPDATRFARRLLELGRLLIVSVPFRWPPKPPTPGHVHDPVTREKLAEWMGRAPNWDIVVREPFIGPKGARLISIYDEDPARVFTRADTRDRRLR
ncbi:MAG: hypothetical protein KDK12_16100 [Rhodobacteraceae bacterium]|nr:hypothetical protein [Paracoccaceae bacterium]